MVLYHLCLIYSIVWCLCTQTVLHSHSDPVIFGATGWILFDFSYFSSELSNIVHIVWKLWSYHTIGFWIGCAQFGWYQTLCRGRFSIFFNYLFFATGWWSLRCFEKWEYWSSFIVLWNYLLCCTSAGQHPNKNEHFEYTVRASHLLSDNFIK